MGGFPALRNRLVSPATRPATRHASPWAGLWQAGKKTGRTRATGFFPVLATGDKIA
ncbi:hypothetical protein [Acetobacter papayae]|uniref:hypothetical protein n=1 Tax=Acetobacter papayae TaxID=1076592 RepID=UPI001F16A1B4|nr:hypothetical protein [Acetobacter papayae]